ncbi:MAG: hypothetical protein ACR2K9_02570 [Solirubrobacteraceae bacterium]
MTLLRAIARLLAPILLAVLAVAGLAIAVFCIGGGTGGLSLPALAKGLHLSGLRGDVGSLLDEVEKPGSVDLVPLLGGLAAMVLGAALLLGSFASRRERLAIAATGEEGTLAARRRPLRQLAGWLLESARGVTKTQVKLRTARRGRSGKLRITAYRPRSSSSESVEEEVTNALAELASAFSLKEQIEVKQGGKGARVQ